MTPLDGLDALGGVQLAPVARGEKMPLFKGWPDTRLSLDEARAVVARGDNIAMRVGSASHNFVDADLDCVEAVELADLYLPETAAQFGRPSKPRSHRLYCSPGATYATFDDPLAKKTLIELRADGHTGGAHLTLLPPSVTGGERREWHGTTIEPALVDAPVLQRRMAWLAIGCLVARYVSEHAARRPADDLPDLLREADHALGRAAFRWLGRSAPDELRGHPKPRAAMSNDELRLAEVVAAIPNDFGWNEWNRLGLAIFAASGGSEEGFVAFDDLSARSVKYETRATRERWANYRRSPPHRIGLGTLVHLARQNGWHRRAA